MSSSWGKQPLSPTREAVGAAPLRDAAAAAARDRNRTMLMARAQAGEREAYRRLLQDITPFIRALATRRLRDASDVEDAVQDVLLTIHAIRHTYDPKRPFAPWLAAIAKRRIVDHLRRRIRTNSQQTPLVSSPETFSEPDANLDDIGVDATALRNAVENLPSGQRQAIKLLKLGEMSLKEAAAASGVSIAALKVATHRALKTLRKVLGDQRRST
jgi:RNA polymerase sigma factor (sigma-70 family)